MNSNAARFARRILLINGLLLVAVLLVVLLAARAIYSDTRAGIIGQAEKRQRLLADETRRGIENHYLSIVEVMDLMHTDEADESDDSTTQKSTATEAEKAGQANVNRAAGSPRSQIGAVMWEQLKSRAVALYAVELHPRARPTSRPAGGPNGGFNGGPNGNFNPDRNFPGRPGDSRTNPPDSPSDNSHPILRNLAKRNDPTGANAPRVDNPVRQQPVAPTRVIGSLDDGIKFEDVLEQCKPWFATVKETATVGRYQVFDGIAANVICVPVQNGRGQWGQNALAAVVPVRGVEARFLDPLKSDPMTAVWLVDENGTTIASSRAGLDGVTTQKNPNLPAAGIPPTTGTTTAAMRHAMSTAEVDRGFSVGAVKFNPSIVTAESVDFAGKSWTLYVATDLAESDAVVDGLFRRAVWWCVFVVVSITAILVSTAVQMIRNRLRTERMRHELLTRELNQARRIQLAWLPADRAIGECVDVAAVNQPASHISGDFYNWFELPDGRMVVTIGDVTGHGMAAAFLMATTQLLVRNTMARLPDPGECLAEVNRQLCVQVFNGQFVTMLVLVLDAAGGHLEIATAGHPAPLMADGESFQPLPIEPQLVLGVDPEAVYVTEHFDLPAESTLLLYTDGVVECPDANDTRFGNEKLRRTVYGRYDSARTIVDQVIKAVDGFRGKRELDDDLTLVALQLQPAPSAKHAGAMPV